ncbi:MAG: hypothetical protein HYY04_14080 [Chloroflexi bacterium]|nr:hypothetical protein [Chloroflexota bacterium]
MRELKRITPESFARFGKVLTWDPTVGKRLQIAAEEHRGAPWMLATFRVDAHQITYLAEHPDSIELFWPVSGTGVILLATPEAPDDFEAFLLDVPIVINRGVWHGLCALSEEVILGIAEDVKAGGSRRDLDRPLRVGLG